MPTKSQHHAHDEYFRKIAKKRERELKLIRKHLGLFLENSELILSRPEYFNITSDAALLADSFRGSAHALARRKIDRHLSEMPEKSIRPERSWFHWLRYEFVYRHMQ